MGVRVVDHPHIHPRGWVRRAVGALDILDLRLPRLKRIAYIRGAADRVPDELAAIRLPVTLITGADLTKGLSQYEVIVVGSRAFETDPDLPANNDRLLAYARNGGTVIMQYQQYGYFLGGFPPYPAHRRQSAAGFPDGDRHHRAFGRAWDFHRSAGGSTTEWTDETAPVTAVNRADPILLLPNRIGPSDWEGWVQERGLYFAHSWGPSGAPVLEMHDRARIHCRADYWWHG